VTCERLSGEHDDRQRGHHRVRAAAPAGSIQDRPCPGIIQVNDGQMGRCVSRMDSASMPTFCQEYLVPVQAQVNFDNAQDIGVVVDDQNHFRLLRCRGGQPGAPSSFRSCGKTDRAASDRGLSDSARARSCTQAAAGSAANIRQFRRRKASAPASAAGSDRVRAGYRRRPSIRRLKMGRSSHARARSVPCPAAPAGNSCPPKQPLIV